MLHFNQRGWFRMFPDGTVPVPSTAKEYYLAKIAGLVNEDGPIEMQLSKAVIPIVKKANVEFVPVDAKSFPDAPEGALMATYNLSEEQQATFDRVGAYATFEAFVDGVASTVLPKRSNPSFPIDGFECRLGISILEYFTGMSSSGTKVIDFFAECEVEPQPKTREEYYLAKKAEVLIADVSWKQHYEQLTDETELTLEELDPDDSGLNRWPHGTISFTTMPEKIKNFDKVVVNGNQEAVLIYDKTRIPESGYLYSKLINGDKFTTQSVDITIWHIGSTDVTEAINFVCFESELVEDAPEPKTRSEFYDYARLGYDESLPEPLTRKEFYNSLLAGHTPTKKKVLFSGYGGPASLSGYYAVNVSAHNIDANMVDTITVILGDHECSYVTSISDWRNTIYGFIIAEDSGDILIHVPSNADVANKVVIFQTVELTAPQPKTPTEFYLAKMAGVEVVGNIEKVFEQEFTFGTEPGGKGEYSVTISNAYDEAVDVSHLIVHIDGNNDNSSFDVDILGGGGVGIKTFDASYAGTTHTLELFYKTVIEDVPVKTKVEQYLKAIAANQNSSDSSESKDVIKPSKS